MDSDFQCEQWSTFGTSTDWEHAPTTVIKINGVEKEDYILCRYYITYYIIYYKLSSLLL